MHQSWTSSVVSTLNALRYSLPLVFKVRPDVVSARRRALGRPSRPLEENYLVQTHKIIINILVELHIEQGEKLAINRKLTQDNGAINRD